MDLAKMGTKQLQDVRKKLAKRANQRMVRLEQSTSSITGDSYAYGAYDKAQRYLDKKGRRRFSESINYSDSRRLLTNEIRELEAFLTSKSSTPTGQRQIEEKRIATFHSGSWGKGKSHRKITTASSRQFYEFLNSNLFSKLTNMGFNSEQLIEIYDAARSRKSNKETIDIISNLYDEWQKNERTGTTKELLKALGLTAKQAFGPQSHNTEQILRHAQANYKLKGTSEDGQNYVDGGIPDTYNDEDY